MKNIISSMVEASRRLANMDPQDEAVQRTVDGLQAQSQMIAEQARTMPKDTFGQKSMQDDVEFIGQQIKKLHQAALTPAQNYRRIANICNELGRVYESAKLPQNAEIRPRLADVVRKVAGVFSEVDTVEDLDKPLEQIEKAVHQLYGDQSQNSTFYFGRRGKGGHEKPQEKE